MKKNVLLLVLQVLIIAAFFLPMIHYKVGEEKVIISGFQAIYTNQYYIIGNILLGIILLGSIILLDGQIYEFINPKKMGKHHHLMIMITNIELFSGLIIVTFLGTFLEWIGLVVIGLLVLNAYIRHVK